MQARNSTRMKVRSHLIAAAASLALASAAWSQLPPPPPRLPTPSASSPQTLPPAQPTQIQPASTAQPAAPPTAHAYRAQVEYANHQLSVSAQNSSLNEILSQIARLTGMKITGGVTEERVYGSYGPDSAQAVLNQLLDGTGANVMLLETSEHTVAELVLTPRNGGPTPPSPSAARDEDRNEENLPPGLAGRRRDFPPGGRRDRIDSNPLQENRSPDQPQGAQPNTKPATTDAAPPQPDASQQSPNGVKTPQQIYDDLVRQQAQQAGQQQSPTTPPQ